MNKETNKSYTRRKLVLSAANVLISFSAFVTFIVSGLSDNVVSMIETLIPNIYMQFIVFTLLFSIAGTIISLPFDYYSGYVLEHRFGLSNQTVPAWVRDEMKGTAVGLMIGLPLLILFFACLQNFGNLWWTLVGIIFFIFSVIMARLAPTLLFPLFYQFKPVESETLKLRLNRLCENVSVRITGILQFNLSKTTKKANAAFAGLGKSKRILLADTLLEHFTEDETEIIFAHEVGHYANGHIRKMLLIGAVMIFAGLGLTAVSYEWIVAGIYHGSITDLSSLPVLALLMMIFSFTVMPVQNMISRNFEREADRYALTHTGSPAIFIAAMQKLSDLNLSDESPHPFIEFLFYSHPSISKRISAAEEYMKQENQ